MTSYASALQEVLTLLDDVEYPWIVSGSTAVQLHGIDLTPGDIDLESTADGAYEIGRRLEPYCQKPIAYSGTDVLRSHFGTFHIDSTTIEVIGDFTIWDGTQWCPPFSAGRNRTLLSTGFGKVPVPSLQDLATQYERLGNHERASLIREWNQP